MIATTKDTIPEVTAAQILSVPFTGELPSALPKSPATYRAIRKHPTVALGRALTVAPVVSAGWSVESDEDANEEMVDFIRANFASVRDQFIQTAMENGIDYGWSPFEQVFTLKEGRVHLHKLKSLLVDITTIMVDPATGAYDGFLQKDPATQKPVYVPVEQTLLVPFRVEGTNWYGESLLENLREDFDWYNETKKGARRYDKKIAGSHWIIYYPEGTSNYNGTLLDNATIANNLLQTLSASGAVAIPRSKQALQGLNQKLLEEAGLHAGWEITLLTDSGKQASFNERFGYIDKLFLRGLIMPERAVIEGEFGTKAEATEHADIALTHMQLIHEHITRLMNWHSVDRLLALNWGEEARGTVWLNPVPLSDIKLEYLRKVYTALLSNSDGALAELDSVDWEAVRESLGIPTNDSADPQKRTTTEVDEDADIDPAIREAVENG